MNRIYICLLLLFVVSQSNAMVLSGDSVSDTKYLKVEKYNGKTVIWESHGSHYATVYVQEWSEFPPRNEDINPLEENLYVSQFLRDRDVIDTIKVAEQIMLDGLDSCKVCTMMGNCTRKIIIMSAHISVGDGGKITMVRFGLSTENALLLTAEECYNITKALMSGVRFKPPMDFGLKTLSFQFAFRKPQVREKWYHTNEITFRRMRESL